MNLRLGTIVEVHARALSLNTQGLRWWLCTGRQLSDRAVWFSRGSWARPGCRTRWIVCVDTSRSFRIPCGQLRNVRASNVLFTKRCLLHTLHPLATWGVSSGICLIAAETLAETFWAGSHCRWGRVGTGRVDFQGKESSRGKEWVVYTGRREREKMRWWRTNASGFPASSSRQLVKPT